MCKSILNRIVRIIFYSIFQLSFEIIILNFISIFWVLVQYNLNFYKTRYITYTMQFVYRINF